MKIDSVSELYVMDGGTASNIIVETGGKLTVCSGGALDGVVASTFFINDIDGKEGFTVSSGGTALNIEAYDGAYQVYEIAQNTYAAGTIDGIPFEFKDGIVSDFEIPFDTEIHLLSDCAASDVIVNGFLGVSSGGRANNIIFNNIGKLIAHGEVNNTTVNDSARLEVISGGTMTNTEMFLWGFLLIATGGAASAISIYDSSHLEVKSGGIADDIRIGYVGEIGKYTWEPYFRNLSVSSGGTATGITASSWEAMEFAIAKDTYIAGTVADSAFEIKDGVLSDAVIDSCALFHILGGGMTDSLVLNEEGIVNVSSGGTANSMIVLNESVLTVFSGGTAKHTVIDSFGSVIVSSGGTADNTVFRSIGEMIVYSGGTADNTTLYNTTSYGEYQRLYCCNGGELNNTTLSGGYVTIYDVGTANNTTIYSGAQMDVDCGSANNIIVNPGGYLRVLAEPGRGYGTATNIVENGGSVENDDDTFVTFVSHSLSGLVVSDHRATVHSGTTAYDTWLKYGFDTKTSSTLQGDLTVYSGGIAIDTTLDGGYFFVQSGGIVDHFIFNDGYFAVLSGGTATNVVWTPCNGMLYLQEGANVSFANSYSGVYCGSGGQILFRSAAVESMTLDRNDEMYVMSNGRASNIDNIRNNARVFVWSGGVAERTTVNSFGSLTVSSGGTADKVTLNSCGSLTVCSGGTATDIVWTPFEGDLSVYNGGYVTFASNYTGIYYGVKDKLLSRTDSAESMTLVIGNGMYVMAGGMARSIMINGGASMYVWRDGFANSATVSSSGILHVSSGGTVTNTSVCSSGTLEIYSCGIANNTVASPTAFITIYSGGTANRSILTGSRIENGGFPKVYYSYQTVSAGGVANYTVVNSYGLLSVSSGGTANYTTLAQAGFLYVSSGGTANCTMFSSGGRLTVLSGGTADDTQINTFGFLLVSSGGKANRTTLSNSGFLYVSSGGMAESTTVNSGGIMWVYSSGTANSITVNENGKLMISSGGTALTVVENGGYIMLDSGVNVEFASHTFSDKTIDYDATVHSGTTADRTIILSGGELAVYFGGTANGTQIEAGGYLFVSSGGSANNTSVGAEGDFYIFDGGTGYNTFIEHGGDLYVSVGGTANDNDVEGRLTVYSGGTANSTNIKSNGHVGIFGTANETVLSGSAFLGYSDAGYGIATWALADVYSGGIANDTTIIEGQLVVLGKTNRTTLYSGGGLYVSSGGTAFHTVVSDSIQCWHMGLQVYEGGTAFDTIICSDGLCMVSGGFTEETVVNSCGLMVVCEMGNADSTTVNFGGEFYVYDVCNSSAPSENGASNTIINSGGAAYLFEFGRMVNTTVNNGGKLRIQDGVASNTTVYSGGTLHVYLDGKATNTTVCSGGKAFVSTGGVFDGTVLNGGIVTGWVDCKDITFSSGAILNIDISGLFGNSGALIRSFSSVEKETNITLTVSGRQANGTYVLADQALGDNRTITVINTTGVEIGTLVTGQTAKINGADYTLNTNNGNLVLQISNSETSSSITQNEKYGDVLLANPIPEAEYMYGCTPTAVGMLLGYYDLYGYGEKDFSNMIEGTVALKSRGTDENGYNMDAFDTVLGRAIASKEYVYRFYSRDSIETTPAQELEYAFKSDNKTLNTDVWNCLADYLGTGQYWRGNENLSTRDIYGSLGVLLNSDNNEIVISDGINTRTIDGKESAMLYGLDLYVKSRGYTLNASSTGTYQVDVNGGYFTFARYMREIDEGRPVVITVEGHSMVGYGYNADTMEIIFDDTAASGQRMTWNSTYNYANENRRLLAITVIALDESSGDSGPRKPIVSANITKLTNTDVLVSAVFGADSVKKEYSLDGVEWHDYIEAVGFTENGLICFRGTDEAGNTAKTTYEVTNIDKVPPVITLSGDNQTQLQSSTLTAGTEDGLDIFWSTDNSTWTKYEGVIEVTANVTYYFKAMDAAGNTGTNFLVFENIIQTPVSDIAPQTQTWEKTEESTKYIVEYSMDNFEHVIQLVVDSNSLDSFQMPSGNYQMRVKADGSEEWTIAAPVVAEEADDEPKLVRSNEDGNADVFFANAVGTWESMYLAQHVGSTADPWGGTKEYVSLYGKNKLADIIEGSTDANILLMTDDDNGDGLFVDDIYSALPGSVTEQQSRIAQIDEIRAGFGNDIVDMTSQQFEYVGDGLTIRGGAGNDTIWANKGDNKLFGDAGNDRIVGASGNDVLAGGIGNDRMHGGGGDDIFTFCENWGTDTVEQLADGSVLLWFASGSIKNWDAENLTYTDGENSVKVSGVTADQITLEFGNDWSMLYSEMELAGGFLDFSSQRIFEESGKGILA